MYVSNSNTEARHPTDLFFDLSPKTHVNSPRYDARSVVLLEQNSDIVWPIECQHLCCRAERRRSSQIGDRICQWWISTGFRFGRSQSGRSTVSLVVLPFDVDSPKVLVDWKSLSNDVQDFGSVQCTHWLDLVRCKSYPRHLFQTFDLWSIREEFFRAKNQDQVIIALTLVLIKSNLFVDLASKSHKIIADVAFCKQSQTICCVVTQIYCNTLMHTVRPSTLNSDYYFTDSHDWLFILIQSNKTLVPRYE